MNARAALALALSAVVGCDRAPARPAVVEATHVTLNTGVVARVGALDVPGPLVAEVARAGHIEPRAALDRLVDDALAAQGAEAEGDLRDPATSWALESILAGATAARLRAAAEAGGPPTDAEVAKLSAIYWRDVDLPEHLRVIHAVVVRPKDSSQTEAARALAARLASVLPGATSDDDFEARAKAFPAGSLKVIVERLPPFVLDGRITEGEPRVLDANFSRGAFALQKPGDTSGVVESTSGFHVIRLIERLPPHVVPLEERRAGFAAAVQTNRAADALDTLLKARRATTPVDIQLGADARMEAVSSSAP